MKSLLFVLSLMFCLMPAVAQPSEASQKISVTTTDVIPFENGISVFLKDTFGEVEVEGWDRNEVEIRLLRSTQKKYTVEASASQARRLEKIKLAITNDASGKLLIETKNIPFLVKNNLELKYQVKVPQAILLKVKHSIGEVQIRNIVGDIEATCKIGEVTLELPEKERYDVDARAKIGDVTSDFGGQYNRQKLVGAKLTEEANRSEPHKLYLRVGIGEVTVKKLESPK